MVASRAEPLEEFIRPDQTWKISLKGARKELPDEDIRRVALQKLQGILLADLGATHLGCSLKKMVEDGNHESDIWRSFLDTFRTKASSTLHKRASSLLRLSKLLLQAGVTRPLRVTEEQLYDALCHLRRSGAGATSAQHMLEALYFLEGMVQLTSIDINTTISVRCKGVARDMHLTKNPLEQKAPLRVDQVMWLEQYMMEASDVEACILGQILFCIHSCSRWSDSQKLRTLSLEKGETEVVYFGQALTSKTTLSAESKTRFLPFIGIGSGLSSCDWASVWVRARMAEQLTFSAFALPSFSERCHAWTSSPMSASEATFWLREFIQMRFSEVSLRELGSHSCKCTLLTWAGRSTIVSFSPSERRLLGHHLEPNMRSVLVYSREAFTTLYSKVLSMFVTIRDGSYNPDMSAVQRVEGAQGLQPAALADGGAGDLENIEISDSESSVASEMGVEDFMIEEDSNETGFDCFPGIPASSLFVHRVSGIVHVVNEDDFAQCGRQLSRNFLPLGSINGDTAHLDGCSQCLRIFSRNCA